MGTARAAGGIFPGTLWRKSPLQRRVHRLSVRSGLAGGFSPIITTAILGYTGSITGISLYMMGIALITLIATFFAHETLGKPAPE